jgi:hypothetical protein
MKKSQRITLTLVAAAAMAACSRRGPDPCQPATFNEWACQDAVNRGGYYWNGSWNPLVYHYPYPYYYDSYHRYVSSGGHVTASPGQSYGRPGGVTRGGFGSSGAAHSSGAGE